MSVLRGKLLIGIIVSLVVGVVLGYNLALSHMGEQVLSREAEVNALRATVARLETQLAGNLTLIAELQAGNSNLTARITGLEAQIQQLQEEIARLRGEPGNFTKFEKVEVTTVYADAVTGGYNITIVMRNSGPATVTMETVNINGKPYDAAYTGVAIYSLTAGKTWTSIVNPGESLTIVVYCPSGSGANAAFSSGVNLEIGLQTTSGNSYPKSVTLP